MGSPGLAAVPRPHSVPWVKEQAALLLGVLPLYLVQSVFHELSYTPIDNSLLFYIAGITCGLVAVDGRHGPAAAPTPHGPEHWTLSPPPVATAAADMRVADFLYAILPFVAPRPSWPCPSVAQPGRSTAEYSP